MLLFYSFFSLFLFFFLCFFCFFFFFFSSRRRHTRSLRDWSSDVCSSDLASRQPTGPRAGHSPPGSETAVPSASFRPDPADAGRREEVAMATLPIHPDLGHLRRQARALQRAAVAGDPQAADRIARNHPHPPADLSTIRLSAAQLTVAREYGFASWPRLRHHLDARAAHTWRPGEEDPSVAARFGRLACLTYS